MLSSQKGTLFYLLCLSSVQGLVSAEQNYVVETGTITQNLETHPKTTSAPNVEELRARNEAQKVLLAANNNICGYINGSSNQPWGCSLSSTCVFSTSSLPLVIPTAQKSSNNTNHDPIPSERRQPGGILCCDGERGCPAEPAPTACVDRGKFEYNTSCTGSCSTDPATLKCTSGIYIYCATLTLRTPSLNALYCNYISAYPTSHPAIVTLNNTFTPTTISHFYSYTPPPINSTSARGSQTSGKVTSTAKSVDGESKKPASKGVVGGVVGGIALVGLVCGGVLFWMRRKKKLEKGKSEESPRRKLVG
ncbi:hypothetical protein GLAREA_12244 [Glarea lozoyensis ATCC 20868]|uniref:Uncharacterized protein n=1 Tax=Glarea lozoyensis (strain ATCC 20868 / MF5171) TaxID=1116229 RepID=S3DYQ7_GLAL2|nr:uncharacterized protein GLAREA_12244 [Glarea lozoyensis ATCC 20868]EPE31488.1 hypothetical protein GLAREA_12244 [Glarea lozoyensis ATCC 20868]